jgi:hypothetical protein
MTLSLKSLLIPLRHPVLSIAACRLGDLGHAVNDNFDDDPPPSASAPIAHAEAREPEEKSWTHLRTAPRWGPALPPAHI